MASIEAPEQTTEQILTAGLRAVMRTMSPMELLNWLEKMPADIQATVMEVINAE